MNAHVDVVSRAGGNLEPSRKVTRFLVNPGSASIAGLALVPLLVFAGVAPRAPSGICINDSVSCTPETKPSGSGIKWHPGHYVVPWLGTPQAQRLTQIDSIANERSVRGMQVRYKWAELETAKGVYNFSVIDTDLARLKSHGKRLIISVLDRKFGSTNPGGVIPQYIVDAGLTYVTSSKDRVATRLWEQPAMDRIIALFAALAARYDSEPYVEGFALEGETAMGPGLPSSYSAANLVAQKTRLIAAVRAAAKRTLFFPFPNFIPGDDGAKSKMSALMRAIFDNKAACTGGPDTLPDSPTHADLVLDGTFGGHDYRNDAAIMYSVESPELGGTKDYTPTQLYDYAVLQQKANYVFWIANDHYGTPEQKWDTGILPMLRSIDGKVVSACPKSFNGACVTN